MRWTSSPRRWRLAAGLAAVVVVGGLIWFSAGPRGDASIARDPVSATRRGLPEEMAAAPTAPAPEAQQMARSHGNDETQVCTGAWVKREPDGPTEQVAYERAIELREVRTAIIAKLHAAPDGLSRIAELLMTTLGRDESHRAALLNMPALCEGADCAALEAATAAVARVRESIATAGLASNDPAVYAAALKVCGTRREGACQLLSARQLARLDPGNASPWLQVLQEARAGKDEGAQLEALHQIANARRNDANAFALTGALLKAAPTDDRAADAVFMTAIAAIGVEMAWIPPYQALIAICSGDALRDANRVQLCGAAAETLAEHSDTVIGRHLGGAIGKRLGWPAERLDRMHGEFNAYTDALTSELVGAGAEPGCDRTKRMVGRLRQTASLGEVGAMRAWIAATGRPPEDFVRVERARQQQAVRAAQEEAASAAASAAR